MKKQVLDFNRLPKQEYQKPAIEVMEADMELQMLAGSVTDIVTTGLGDDITTTPEPTTNPWGEAMTREFEVEDEWDWSEE